MDLQSLWVVMGYEVGAGTDERVGGMVNGTSLASVSIAGSGVYGGRDLCPQ